MIVLLKGGMLMCCWLMCSCVLMLVLRVLCVCVCGRL